MTKKLPKKRDMNLLMHIARKGAGAGAHKSKGQRGSGKGSGKWGRHPKHKQARRNEGAYERMLLPGRGEGHSVSEFSPWQISKGRQVEREHIERAIASGDLTPEQIQEVTTKISLDHLAEFPDYYTWLDLMEWFLETRSKIFGARANTSRRSKRNPGIPAFLLDPDEVAKLTCSEIDEWLDWLDENYDDSDDADIAENRLLMEKSERVPGMGRRWVQEQRGFGQVHGGRVQPRWTGWTPPPSRLPMRAGQMPVKVRNNGGGWRTYRRPTGARAKALQARMKREEAPWLPVYKKLPPVEWAYQSLGSKKPDQVVARGKFKFVRYHSDWDSKRSKFVNKRVIYTSKLYTDPTYEDAWREFRKAQHVLYKEIGPFNHVYLESVDKAGPGKLTFGTGS